MIKEAELAESIGVREALSWLKEMEMDGVVLKWMPNKFTKLFIHTCFVVPSLALLLMILKKQLNNFIAYISTLLNVL